MGLLARALLLTGVLASGCYEPSLQDCTLACSTENDCASGQVCGADKFCAIPELAGRCFERPVRDAGPDDPDASTTPDGGQQVVVDAAVPTPDAGPTQIAINVRVEGKGFVQVDTHGTCDSDPPQSGQCVFNVPLGQLVTVRAFADNGWMFERWTTSTCPFSSNSTCTFSPLIATEVGAKFKKGDDDGDDD